MRLDKYLKVTRLIKRRSIAKELADADRIKVNGRLAKPSTFLEINDIIEITFRNNQACFQVLELRDHVKKDDIDLMYKMIENEVSYVQENQEEK
ncbi:MAG: RNA-binding S4 domain-containing protein [Erysipelothrix sp.]|nr:RNA-binding S4 domain-containing protein [Erysipelothrix sp.]